MWIGRTVTGWVARSGTMVGGAAGTEFGCFGRGGLVGVWIGGRRSAAPGGSGRSVHRPLRWLRAPSARPRPWAAAHAAPARATLFRAPRHPRAVRPRARTGEIARAYEPASAATPRRGGDATLMGRVIDSVFPFTRSGAAAGRSRGCAGVGLACAFELLGELGGAAESLFEVRSEGAREESAQGTGQAGVALVDRDDAACAQVGQELLGMRSGNRKLVRQGLVRDRRQGPEVAAVVDLGREERLLRAHVAGRPEDQAGRRGEGRRHAVALHRPRDPEVEELDEQASVFVARQEDVGRLQIAVDDAGRVRLGEGAGDLRDQPRRSRTGRGVRSAAGGVARVSPSRSSMTR